MISDNRCLAILITLYENLKNEHGAFSENDQNFKEKTNELAKFLVTFGQSPNVTHGNFLEPISLKFNDESNACIHLSQNGVESA